MARNLIVTTVLALSACQGIAYANEPFEHVKVILEQNVQDKDSEVKF